MKLNFQKYEVNEQQKSIVFACCSDTAYERYDQERQYYYDQILVISEQTVDMSRLNGGAAPLLFNHNPENLIGIIERAWIVDNRVFVKALFRKNDEQAEKLWQDIIDGTVKGISIGYQISHYTEKKENGKAVRYIDSFLIYECSVVSIPADYNGVGFRSFEFKDKDKEKVEDIKETETAPVDEAPEQSELEKVKAELEELKQKVAEMEKPVTDEAETDAEVEAVEETPVEQAPVDDSANRQNEIEAIGQAFDVSEQDVERAINSKISVRDFKEKVKNNFYINNKETKTMKSNELREFFRSGEANKSFMLRDAYTGFGGQTGEAGAGLIATETYPLVAALQKRMGVKGFRTLNGLKNQVTIPVQTGRQSVAVKAFHNGADETNPVFTNKTLTANLITGETRIGKDLLLQCNDDITAFIVDSLTKEIAYKVQDYMISKVATGATGKVEYSALSAIDWADILAFEAAVGAYNLNPAFVMSASARATLKGIEKATNTAQFICMDNEINGYAVNVSGCVGNDKIYFGDYSKLILAVFGDGLEIQIDPYTYSSTGDVKVVARMGIDAVVEDGNAFVIGDVEAEESSELA